MLNTILLYIYIWAQMRKKIPLYVGYQAEMRRKITKREEEGRSSTLAVPVCINGHAPSGTTSDRVCLPPLTVIPCPFAFSLNTVPYKRFSGSFGMPTPLEKIFAWIHKKPTELRYALQPSSKKSFQFPRIYLKARQIWLSIANSYDLVMKLHRD